MTDEVKPSDERILELAHRTATRYAHGHREPYNFNESQLLHFARSVLGAAALPSKTEEGEPVAPDEDAQWAIDRGADFLEQYAAYIHRVKPEDIEEHPYLPELENVAQQLRALRTWPLYASPLHQEVGELTDEEILSIYDQHRPLDDGTEAIAFVRALQQHLRGEKEESQIAHLEDVLRNIGDFCHDHSTGPAVPDALWLVREMAYDALRAAPSSLPQPSTEESKQ